MIYHYYHYYYRYYDYYYIPKSMFSMFTYTRSSQTARVRTVFCNEKAMAYAINFSVYIYMENEKQSLGRRSARWPQSKMFATQITSKNLFVHTHWSPASII